VDNTGAERQRRYIARLKTAAANAPNAGELAKLRKELAQAKARIAELTHELTAWKGDKDKAARRHR
jgi:hypothetical protein